MSWRKLHVTKLAMIKTTAEYINIQPNQVPTDQVQYLSQKIELTSAIKAERFYKKRWRLKETRKSRVVFHFKHFQVETVMLLISYNKF